MKIDNAAIQQLFLDARTANGFLDKPVPTALLQEIYDIAKMGATSMNAQPTRYVFLTNAAAKQRLMPALSPGNVAKTESAPVCVIVATDNQFYEHMPVVFPNNPGAKALFEGNAALAQGTATRNGTLSGVDLAKVNAEFFPDGRYSANFLINLGYGDDSKLFPRNPRLTFEQACTVY